MADDPNRRSTGAFRIAQTTIPRDPRAGVIVPVRYRYESILDFVDSQSVNISRTGLFMAGGDALPVGTAIEFEFALSDGYVLLHGKAEVMRVSVNPKGIGVRFTQLDEASRALIDRIVDVNLAEGRKPTVPMEFLEAAAPGVPSAAAPTGNTGALRTPASAGGVTFKERDLRIQLNTSTVSYFIYNPLLNIKLGGFVVPATEDVALGTLFAVVITDLQDGLLFQGKGKVVAKHENRLGIRLTEADKPTLAKLQAEVTRLTPK